MATETELPISASVGSEGGCACAKARDMAYVSNERIKRLFTMVVFQLSDRHHPKGIWTKSTPPGAAAHQCQATVMKHGTVACMQQAHAIADLHLSIYLYCRQLSCTCGFANERSGSQGRPSRGH